MFAALNCSVPPPKAIVPADPSAPADASTSVPSPSAVPPVYVFAPPSVSV